MMTVGSWMTVEVELSNANDLLADLTRIKHPNVNNEGGVEKEKETLKVMILKCPPCCPSSPWPR